MHFCGFLNPYKGVEVIHELKKVRGDHLYKKRRASTETSCTKNTEYQKRDKAFAHNARAAELVDENYDCGIRDSCRLEEFRWD